MQDPSYHGTEKTSTCRAVALNSDMSGLVLGTLPPMSWGFCEFGNNDYHMASPKPRYLGHFLAFEYKELFLKASHFKNNEILTTKSMTI